jgi:acylphosphatase
MQCRRHVHYSGDVQGIGFRYTAAAVARGWVVLGYVRNLHDGRVEIVAEGEESEVAAFLVEVAEAMASHIGEVRTADETPTGEFSTFRVAF